MEFFDHRHCPHCGVAIRPQSTACPPCFVAQVKHHLEASGENVTGPSPVSEGTSAEGGSNSSSTGVAPRPTPPQDR